MINKVPVRFVIDTAGFTKISFSTACTAKIPVTKRRRRFILGTWGDVQIITFFQVAKNVTMEFSSGHQLKLNMLVLRDMPKDQFPNMLGAAFFRKLKCHLQFYNG